MMSLPVWLPEGPLSGGILCPEGSLSGGSLSRVGSLSRGASVRETPPPLYGKEWAVRILLERVLV